MHHIPNAKTIEEILRIAVKKELISDFMVTSFLEYKKLKVKNNEEC